MPDSCTTNIGLITALDFIEQIAITHLSSISLSNDDVLSGNDPTVVAQRKIKLLKIIDAAVREVSLDVLPMKKEQIYDVISPSTSQYQLPCDFISAHHLTDSNGNQITMDSEVSRFTNYDRSAYIVLDKIEFPFRYTGQISLVYYAQHPKIDSDSSMISFRPELQPILADLVAYYAFQAFVGSGQMADFYRKRYYSKKIQYNRTSENTDAFCLENFEEEGWI